MEKQPLIIISGITGAIGNALLAQFAPHSTIYGVSRKGLFFSNFIDLKTKKLYPKTLITSIGELNEENIKKFIRSIDTNKFESITYFHSLGLYPFEVNKLGEHFIENDYDKDGINDITNHLTYEVFKLFTSEIKKLTENYKIPGRALVFGSLADKHEPKAHYSWWQTMKKTRTYMKNSDSENFGFHIINISSVSCAHEIVTRPFIFIHTDSKIEYWLKPSELAVKINEKINNTESFHGFYEYEIFNNLPQFNNSYYKDCLFTPRKVAELY